MPTFYLLGLGWVNGWVLFESAHHLPVGYELGELFQNPQLTHNAPTGYIALHPQCYPWIQRIIWMMVIESLEKNTLVRMAWQLEGVERVLKSVHTVLTQPGTPVSF